MFVNTNREYSGEKSMPLWKSSETKNKIMIITNIFENSEDISKHSSEILGVTKFGNKQKEILIMEIAQF